MDTTTKGLVDALLECAALVEESRDALVRSHTLAPDYEESTMSDQEAIEDLKRYHAALASAYAAIFHAKMQKSA